MKIRTAVETATIPEMASYTFGFLYIVYNLVSNLTPENNMVGEGWGRKNKIK